MIPPELPLPMVLPNFHDPIIRGSSDPLDRRGRWVPVFISLGIRRGWSSSREGLKVAEGRCIWRRLTRNSTTTIATYNKIRSMVCDITTWDNGAFGHVSFQTAPLQWLHTNTWLSELKSPDSSKNLYEEYRFYWIFCWNAKISPSNS